MISEALQKARDFEARYGLHIPDSERPAFHAAPTIGWMNDPNGFSLYKGEYHLFYQYHPYSNEWGPMHWGHLKSKDLIRWLSMYGTKSACVCADVDVRHAAAMTAKKGLG